MACICANLCNFIAVIGWNGALAEAAAVAAGAVAATTATAEILFKCFRVCTCDTTETAFNISRGDVGKLMYMTRERC